MGALDLVESIPGWLRSEDADMLYELARSTPGPILEIGTYHGKSAVLMALAGKGGYHDPRIFTLDVNMAVIEAATAQAEAHGVLDRIVFVRGTTGGFARAYPHLRPTVTFVDGDHSRGGVTRDLEVLEAIVPTGGRLLFHDFHDPANEDPSRDEVRVRPAVDSSWVVEQCDFDGTFGCCGLFTRRRGGPSADAAIADLICLGGARDQYLHRLRYPAGRLLTRIRTARRM